jgi:adenylate cyclase, class 2
MYRREIEIKAEVENLEDLVSKLESLGCKFSNAVKQADRIYIGNGQGIPAPRGTNVLRIREQDGKYLFTLKQAQTNQLDSLERETHIEDPKVMYDIFKLLGFYEVAMVTKVRRKTTYQEYEICIDQVEELGSFIEIEKVVETDYEMSDEESMKVQEELMAVLTSFGVDPAKRVFTGYDNLMVAKNKG